MANVTTIEGNVINVTGLTEDWDGMAACPELLYYQTLGGMKVASIRFDPSAKDDLMVIKEDSATGAVIFRKKAEDEYDNKPVYYSGRRMRPYIDISDCVFTDPASARVTIELADTERDEEIPSTDLAIEETIGDCTLSGAPRVAKVDVSGEAFYFKLYPTKT